MLFFTQFVPATCVESIRSINRPSIVQSKLQISEAANLAFKKCLSEYIQIETISPEGNEHLAVNFFEKIFSQLDFPYKVYEVPSKVIGQSGTRQNIVATLSNTNAFDYSLIPQEKSIILANHMDVVSVNPEQWENPEFVFSGKISPSLNEESGREYLWGRGALDMKSVAIMQLISMTILKNSDIELNKDIHFLALADEEEANSGAIGTVELMKDGGGLQALSRAELLLNESGGAVQDVPKENLNLHLIATEEKGLSWYELSHPFLDDLLQAHMDLGNFRYKTNKIEIRKYPGLHCSIDKISTPNSKVNVIASKIFLELNCHHNIDEEILRRAFTHKFKYSKATVTKRGTSYNITLETKSSSHGSIALSDSALDILVTGLARLKLVNVDKKRKRKPSFFKEVSTKTTKVFIQVLSEHNPLLRFLNKLSFVKALKRFMLRQVADTFGIDGLFRTTCEISAISFERLDGAKSLLDCRTLHTMRENKDEDIFKNELKDYLDDFLLKFKTISFQRPTSSNSQSETFKSLKRAIEFADPKAVVSPYLFPASTDNGFFRRGVDKDPLSETGIPSYGFFPVILNADLLSTMHGSNERFPVDQINSGLSIYVNALKYLLRDSE